MKFFSVTATATATMTLALVALAACGGSSVVAKTCDAMELATSVADIIVPALDCQDATGYAMVLPTTKPTATQTASICSQCKALVRAAPTVTFPSCTLQIHGAALAIATLFNGIVSKCGGGLSASPTAPTATITAAA